MASVPCCVCGCMGALQKLVVQQTQRCRVMVHKQTLATLPTCIQQRCNKAGCSRTMCANMSTLVCSASLVAVPLHFVLGLASRVCVPSLYTFPHLQMLGARLIPCSPAQGKTDLLLATAQLSTPQEALKLGLLDDVVPTEQLAEAAESALQRFLRVDQFARAATKARQRQEFSLAWQVPPWTLQSTLCA